MSRKINFWTKSRTFSSRHLNLFPNREEMFYHFPNEHSIILEKLLGEEVELKEI